MKALHNIVWYCPHPTHYHAYFFSKVIDSQRFKLELVFFQSVMKKYPWKTKLITDIKASYLSKGFLGVDWSRLYQEISIRKNERIALVAGWAEPTMILLLTYWSLRNRSFLIYTDVPKPRRGRGMKEILRAWWLYYILRKAKGILVTGRNGKEVVESWPVDRTPVFNFPFVTDLNHFKPIPSQPKRTPLQFVSSGRLDIAHKGYDIALAALKTFKDRQSQIEFEYKIAGTGPDEAKIRQLIKDYQLEKEITLLGWLEFTDLPDLYNSADIFIHASNFDPYPNAVLEAMACGTIVIASTAAGSAADRIIDGHNGFLYRQGNIGELASKIQRVVSLSPAEAIGLKQQARKTAEEWDFTYNLNALEQAII